MPHETVPSAAIPDPSRSRSSSFLLGVLGCGGAALVGVLALVVTLAWGSTDFPRVAPEEMADRALQRSQKAYEVMGFDRTIEPGVERIGVSTQNTFGSGFCYDGGLLGLEDKTVDGAYSMSHNWALDHVPASQAIPGLRRLHRFFKDNGWKITSYDEAGQGKDGELFVQRAGGDERMSFTWYPDREYFTGGVSMPCAYDPQGKTTDSGPARVNHWPPAFGPAQRH
ncbi:hypothetical protein AB0O22_30290 [Streptomyces sp. NPDC091204]|uniref:hypothetical protein n=1 Tax=Streptomyces sp. NPDC091204 TaxID=3155299 RepID=UPI003418C901